MGSASSARIAARIGAGHVEIAQDDVAHVRGGGQVAERYEEQAREHTRLLTRASDWENNKRNPSFFLSGDGLDAAEKWLASASSRSPPRPRSQCPARSP